MAERRPLIMLGGQIQELPSGDTLPGVGGGGGSSLGLLPYVELAAAGQLVSPDGLSFGGSTTSIANNQIIFQFFSRRMTLDALIFRNTTVGAGGSTALGAIYSADPNTLLPDTLIDDTPSQTLTTTGVEKALVLNAGDYTVADPVWLAILLSASVSCYSPVTNLQMMSGLYSSNFISSTPAWHHIRASYAFAALPADTSGLTLALSGANLPSVAARVA